MARRRSAGNTGLARPGLGFAAAVLILAACSTRVTTPSPDPSPDGPSPSGLACGTGEAGFRAAAAQLDRELLFEDQTLQLVTAAMSMRDGSLDTGDSIPEFVGLGAETTPVHLPRGVSGRLAGQSGLQLTGAQVNVYNWDQFTFAEGELPTSHSSGTAGFAMPDGRGAISVAAPTRSGDYVLGMTLQWQTACLSGDGAAYARLIVE